MAHFIIKYRGQLQPQKSPDFKRRSDYDDCLSYVRHFFHATWSVLHFSFSLENIGNTASWKIKFDLF